MKAPAKKPDRQEHDHADREPVVTSGRARLNTQRQRTIEHFGLSTDYQYHWSIEYR